MKTLYKGILFLLAAFAAAPALSGAGRVLFSPPDSLVANASVSLLQEYIQDTTGTTEERNKEFYDELKERSRKNKFYQMLHDLLIRSPKNKDTKGRVVDEQKYYAHYAGKYITAVEIYNRPIFDNARSYLQKGMEYVHTSTWRSAIRRDLMFKAGDEVDPDLIVRTKQVLQSRKYLYDAQIIINPDPQDTAAVIMQVVTRDRWTIGVDGMVKGLTGRIAGDVYDHNFIGSGNKLRYRISFDWKNGTYEGSLFEYYIPNMWGTFYEANFTVGRSFWRDTYKGLIDKKMLLPEDYIIGINAGWEQTRLRDVTADGREYLIYAAKELDVWAGKSFLIEPWNSSIYFMGRYQGLDFTDIPLPVGPGLNPYFHDRQYALASLGFYRQNYMAASLIYGYGYTEYIPTGFLVELNGGYSWQEFGEGWYSGASARAGGFIPGGYLMGGVRAGGYFGFGERDFHRTAVSVDLTYFTNLLNFRKSKFQFRQFFNLNLMWGINRAEGISEYVMFTRESGPRYFYDYAYGRNRLVLNTESVLFTPWDPLGFNIALFGFVDVGLIGDNNNLFRNDIFSTVGFGVRLRNEMLVFSTIELSITLGFNKHGLIKTEYVRLGGEKRITIPTFLPDKPQIVEYL